MKNAQNEDEFPWAEYWPEIGDPRVRAAFGKVSREAFVADSLRRYAHQDVPLPIGEGQTISQPFVVALMLQALDLKPGEKVLEIGTGSGYQTAIICELTAVPDGVRGATVYSVERFATLADNAVVRLIRLGYRPHIRVGDGAAGWPEAAPFDAIVVSAAASHVPQPLWEQLAEGGRMILPVGEQFGEQELWLVRKQNSRFRYKRMGGVRFVPLVSPLLDDPSQWAEGR
ncbi:MAG: protein-L-isoaspartate(D-aspartate) O-methyltransferase [Caldilineaceae bacterium]|nr:protein-L-isoaspartate(D-aspartate) O-methyltransferase [Caldilineaceae bacterium]